MKFESFCLTKETTSKLKRCPTELQKIFASCSIDKGLVTRIIHKEQKNKQTNTERRNSSINISTSEQSKSPPLC